MILLATLKLETLGMCGYGCIQNSVPAADAMWDGKFPRRKQDTKGCRIGRHDSPIAKETSMGS